MDGTERPGTPAQLATPPATVVGMAGALVTPHPPRVAPDRLDRPVAEPNFPR